MKEELREIKLPVDFESRLDGMPMSEIDRLRAKAHLARAEAQAELIARAARGVMKLLRLLIVRPRRRAYRRERENATHETRAAA